MRAATAAAHKQRSASHEVFGNEAYLLGWFQCPRATIQTASSSVAVMLKSFNAFWSGLAHEIPCSSTAWAEQRAQSVSRGRTNRPGSGVDQSISGPGACPWRGRYDASQLCARSASFFALVGDRA